MGTVPFMASHDARLLRSVAVRRRLLCMTVTPEPAGLRRCPRRVQTQRNERMDHAPFERKFPRSKSIDACFSIDSTVYVSDESACGAWKCEFSTGKSLIKKNRCFKFQIESCTSANTFTSAAQLTPLFQIRRCRSFNCYICTGLRFKQLGRA
jgi:hypothetical protein